MLYIEVPAEAGTKKIAIPREIEDRGPAAIEAFVRGGGESETTEAPAKRRRAPVQEN